MNSIPGYSMILAASTTLILSLIFLFLSSQARQKYLSFWGYSCLIYALMFTLDFIHIQTPLPSNYFILLRQFFALWGSYLFFSGSCHFFQRPQDKILLFLSLFTTAILIISGSSTLLFSFSLIFVIIICSGFLFFSGCIFISYSWTQVLPEKYIASFLIFLWGIFLNHYQYSHEFLSLAIVTYFLSILIVNVLMLVLLIVYFKKASFIDQKNSERFKTLVENSSDIMFLFNYDTNSFEYVSPGIINLIGVSASDLYYSPEKFFSHISAVDNKKSLYNLFNRRISVAGSGSFSRSVDEKVISWSEIHYIPIKDNTNTVTAVEGILRDITHRKLLEESIKENEKTKKEFLENIQHEIKTPITLIQGYTESLMTNVIPEESVEIYLNIINSKAKLLTTLVNDLTQVSEFTSQDMDFSFYEIDAKELFEELAESFKAQISQADRLPEVDIIIEAGATVIADKNRLHQVVSNLVNNAIRHTPSGSLISFSGRMSSTPREPENADLLSIPDGMLVLSISDMGCGFNDSDIDSLFKRNFSEGKLLNPDHLVVNSQNLKHFGLGLHISQTIIRHHSGFIEASNNINHGATVTFTIPFYLS